jgi:hypothetical protein
VNRPYIADQGTEVVVGLALLVAAFVLLYDAFEGRGGKKPRLLGPILPW